MEFIMEMRRRYRRPDNRPRAGYRQLYKKSAQVENGQPTARFLLRVSQSDRHDFRQAAKLLNRQSLFLAGWIDQESGLHHRPLKVVIFRPMLGWQVPPVAGQQVSVVLGDHSLSACLAAHRIRDADGSLVSSKLSYFSGGAQG